MVPVTVGDLTGRGVISYDFQITFDPTVIQPMAPPYDSTGTLSSGMQITPNTNNPGHLIVSAFQAPELTGSGTLLFLKFTIIGTAGQSTPLNFENYVDPNNVTHADFRFNNGTPARTLTNGNLTVIAPTPSPTPTPSPFYTISGHISYADPGGPVKNATVTLTGNNGFTPQVMTTNINGDYSFAGLPGGNDYVVTPTKTGDANNIESFDASNVARYVAGLDNPTNNQQIAADADNDSVLTSFDASLIARFVAGLLDYGIVGTWKFLPANRTYPMLNADRTNQNYTAILVGETSGNWIATGPFVPGDRLATATDTAAVSTDDPQPSNAVTVTLPDMKASPGTNITVPVKVSDLSGFGVRALDLDLVFDPSVLQPQAAPTDTEGTLTAGMLITPNASVPGHLIISGFQMTEVGGSGTLIYLKFIVVGTPRTTTPIGFADFRDGNAVMHPGLRFNAGSPIAIATKGSISVVGSGTGHDPGQ